MIDTRHKTSNGIDFPSWNQAETWTKICHFMDPATCDMPGEIDNQAIENYISGFF